MISHLILITMTVLFTTFSLPGAPVADPPPTPTPRPCRIRYPNGGCYRTPPGCKEIPGGSICEKPGVRKKTCAPHYHMENGQCVPN